MKNHNKSIAGEFMMILPSFLIVFSITAYVFINTFIESLGIIPELFLDKITWAYYAKLLTDQTFIRGFTFSLTIAIISSTLSITAGVYFSYMLSRSKQGKRAFWYRYPIILSYIAAAVLIYNTYSPKGLIYHIFMLIGVELNSLDIIYNKNGLAVILLNIFKAIPYVAFSLYPIFLKTDEKYRETAKNLGCTDMQYIYRILLPLCKHSILTSFLILFNYNLFAYEGFYFLGPSTPISVGVLAYNAYIHPDLAMRSLSMAMNFIMMFISALLCILFYKSLKQNKKGISL